MIGRRSRRDSRRASWLAAALATGVVAIAGCGGDDHASAGASKKPGSTTTTGDASRVRIITRMTASGVVLRAGSTIGGAPFCPRGTITDTHGTNGVGLVDRTFTCPDGTLRMGFDPQLPTGNTQRGPWRIISGTGAYKGWHGDGRMVIRYDAGDTSEHPLNGRETFTGSLTQ